jgi:excisionase family DNA binding protein
MKDVSRIYLSPKEVAEALGLSIHGVRLLIRTGRLPARRLRGGRAIRIAIDDLDRLFEPLPLRQPREPAQADPAASR